jgi:hypothetical protein
LQGPGETQITDESALAANIQRQRRASHPLDIEGRTVFAHHLPIMSPNTPISTNTSSSKPNPISVKPSIVDP